MGFLQFFMQELPETAQATSASKLTLLDFAIKGGWMDYDSYRTFVAGGRIHLHRKVLCDKEGI